MKKRHLLLLLCLLLTVPLCVYADPAKPGVKKTLTLADGTKIVAELVGDEFGSYWLGTDGKAYHLAPGNKIYRQVDAKKIMEYAQERRNMANKESTRRKASKRAGGKSSFTGKKKCLIILVNFSDVSFQKENTRDLFDRFANEKKFSEGDFKGSVYDYFYDQSIGASERFELDFDVVGPYTLSHKQKYYGAPLRDKDGNIIDNDSHTGEMVIEALKLADESVNYADYVWDKEGEVAQVYVIYAGKAQSDRGGENTIWPHHYSLDGCRYWYNDGTGALTLDDVIIDTYACSSELNGSGKIVGIGTFCHEFSHCLGLPDFYDAKTDDNDKYFGQGMGLWDLMGSGNHNDDGYQPAGYTSYERMFFGWETPTMLLSSKSVKGMRSLQDGGGSYMISNPNHYDEYYLLENRQKTGWDASLPSNGLLIVHVDYDKKAWDYNKVNVDPVHQRMTWMPADHFYNKGLDTDTYPYKDENGNVINNCFNKDSNPAAWLHHPNANGEKYLDSSVEEITQNDDGTISFEYVFSDYLNVISLELENWNPTEGYINDTYMKGSVTIQNTSEKTINQKITVRLIDADLLLMKSYPINISLDPDEYKEYDFRFSNLVVGRRYFVNVSYLSGIEFYRSDVMLCKNEDSGEIEEGNEALMAYEYWFDDDIAGRKTVSMNSNKAIIRTSVDARNLPVGLHYLQFRVQRDDGSWSGISSSPFMKLDRSTEARLDYWIDDDYENRVSLPIVENEDEQLLTFDLSECSVGMHQLNYQVTLPGLLPGAVEKTTVMKLPSGVAPQLEYWFDDDLAHSQTLDGRFTSEGDDYIYVNTIDMSNLSKGVHRLNFRATGSSNQKRSSVMSCSVMKFPLGTGNRLQYWYDDDKENAVTLDNGVSEDDCLVYEKQLNMSSLSAGVHRLNFRAISSGGQRRSPLMTAYVMKYPLGKGNRLQYWYDDDKAHAVTLEGVSENDCFVYESQLNMSSLSTGVHRLNFRAISTGGQRRSPLMTSYVMKMPLGKGNRLEYWYDDDEENAVVLDGVSEDDCLVYESQLNMSNLSVGLHRLSFRAVSNDGQLKSPLMTCYVMRSVTGSVSRLEYWFDDDRDNIYTMSGHAAEAGANGYIFAGELDISKLSPGHHRLHYRGIGNDRQLSTATSSASILVKIDSHGDAVMASYSISVDGDDFIAQGLLDAKAEVDFSYVLNAKDLGKGIHTLQTTFWNSYGMSVSETTSFEVTYGDDDAINTPQADEDEDGPIYNLSGMRVNSNAKGILIKNGKKYLVK